MEFYTDVLIPKHAIMIQKLRKITIFVIMSMMNVESAEEMDLMSIQIAMEIA